MSDEEKFSTDEAELQSNEAVEADAAEGEVIADEEAAGNIEELLEQALQEAAEANDRALRAAAEAQNIRRRASKDVENARKFALEKFTGELLVVVDNLERALESANNDSGTARTLVEGVELTYKSFLDVLKKFNVSQVDPLGEPFDPEIHQAISVVDNPDAEPNTVVHVMQKGYSLNGRLMRPAMVVVSKAADQTAHVDEQA